MSVEDVPLCDACPLRGLCLGNVALSVEKTYIAAEADASGTEIIATYPGAEIVATDSDGVESSAGYYTNETTTRYQLGQSGVAAEQGVPTTAEAASRNDLVTNALRHFPEPILKAVTARAARCKDPHREEFLVYEDEGKELVGVFYQSVCPAGGEEVLEYLAKNLQ